MMNVLLESAGARGPRRTGWAAASLTFHAALIAAAVVVTTQAPEVAAAVDEPPEQPIFIPIRDEPRPRKPMIPDAPRLPSDPAIPVSITAPAVPTIDVSKPFSPAPISPAEIFARRPADATSTSGTGVPTHGAETVASVDRIAAPLAGNGQPEYPRPLRGMGLEGEVLVTFVVDTTGRAEPGSITVVSATHELFGDAVRRWLARTRYTPAELRGQRVRQLVQQQIGFTLER